jgi:predicted enzyme related to lactoylglutathione lyase
MTNPIAHFEIMGKDAIALQAYLERVTQAGGQVLMPATPVTETLTIALFADPGGNTVGMLTEHPASP